MRLMSVVRFIPVSDRRVASLRIVGWLRVWPQKRYDAAAQWRSILMNIKSDLEELGTLLEHWIRLTFFVKGPFPNGGVLSSPNFRQDVLDEFFARHCSVTTIPRPRK
jgi:enamine deaminase RidA (YjgF/YER057c/UK114 family)